MHRVKDAHDALLASFYDEGNAAAATVTVATPQSLPSINTAAIASILEVDASEVALAPLSDSTAQPHQVRYGASDTSVFGSVLGSPI